MDQKEIESQFFQLVLGLQSSAWMLLGKVANPMTGQLEKNLEAAKQTIDTLEMLGEKCKGNLNTQEEELLKGAIQQLQVNYVEEAKNPEKPTEEKVESEKKEEEKKPVDSAKKEY